MTEEEAKTKWCPFARAISGKMLPDGSADAPAVQATFNRVAVGPTQHMTPNVAKCIGSACMAWRESEVYDTRAKELWSKKKGERVNSAYGSDAEWRLVNPDEPLPPAQGWCGLAGKP